MGDGAIPTGPQSPEWVVVVRTPKEGATGTRCEGLGCPMFSEEDEDEEAEEDDHPFP